MGQKRRCPPVREVKMPRRKRDIEEDAPLLEDSIEEREELQSEEIEVEESVPEEVLRSSLESLSLGIDKVAQDRLLSRDEERELLLVIKAGKKALQKLSQKYGLPEEDVVQFIENQAPHPLVQDPLAPFVERMREARSTLILSNIRLVLSVAQKYALQHRMPLQDLAQEGVLGLIEAIERFDLQRDVKLSTYAVWRIRYAVQRGIASMLPGPMRGSEYQPNLSLDASAGEDEEPLGKTVPATNTSPEERGEMVLEAERVAQALRRLDPRLAFVLAAKYGLLGVKPMDSEEIAWRLRVTPGRVRELEKQALKLLKGKLVNP
jgi:RNA polymerase sigma factor (sigma-70 family)